MVADPSTNRPLLIWLKLLPLTEAVGARKALNEKHWICMRVCGMCEQKAAGTATELTGVAATCEVRPSVRGLTLLISAASAASTLDQPPPPPPPVRNAFLSIGRFVHITHFTSPHLTSSQLTPFQLNWGSLSYHIFTARRSGCCIVFGVSVCPASVCLSVCLSVRPDVCPGLRAVRSSLELILVLL